MNNILEILEEELDFMIDNQPAPKADILQNWADITKIKKLGFSPKTKFKDKLKEIIRNEI